MTFASLAVALAAFALAQPLVKDLLGAEVGVVFFSRLGVLPVLGALVLAVALAAGAYPALVLSRVRPVSAIAVARASLGSSLFSTLLVGAQFAIASFLLITLAVMSDAERRDAAHGAQCDRGSARRDRQSHEHDEGRRRHVARSALCSASGSRRYGDARDALGVAAHHDGRQRLPIRRARSARP